MPTQTQEINKVALNALTNLYYLYVDLVRHALRTDEPTEELDIFYLRGGLKHMIEKYHTHSALDAITVETLAELPAIADMLPRRAVSDITALPMEKITLAKGDLKYLSDGHKAYAQELPDEVTELIEQGRKLLNNRLKRSRSIAEIATVDLSSAVIAYEEHVLKIGPKGFPVRTWTLEDLVLDYMFNHCTKDEWVDRDRIVTWVIDTLNDESKKSKAIYDKCVAINKKIKSELDTTLDLFDTSRDGFIKRNY